MKAEFEPPKLSPWPFILGDVVLLGSAFWIASRSEGPIQTSTVWAVASLVGLGAISLGLPFVVNFSRRQDVALAERQKEIAALAETTAASAEQLSVAVAGLSTVAEAAHRAAKQAEHLPQRLQERVNEFKEQLNEVAVNENEALSQELNTLRAAESDRLEAGVDRIQKLVTELRQVEERLLEARTSLVRQVHAAADEAVSRLRAEVAALEVRVAAAPPVRTAPEEPPPSVPEPAPKAASLPVQLPHSAHAAPPPSPPQLPAAGEPAAPVDKVEEPEQSPAPVERKRSRRPRPDDSQPGLDLGLQEEEPAREEPAVSLSADGATRLVVTAYIGIGNKLHARGEGGGLSPSVGVPLQFVSIGKWRWEVADLEKPVRLQLFKNDQQPALDVGVITLEPGQQVEVKASFQS